MKIWWTSSLTDTQVKLLITSVYQGVTLCQHVQLPVVNNTLSVSSPSCQLQRIQMSIWIQDFTIKIDLEDLQDPVQKREVLFPELFTGSRQYSLVSRWAYFRPWIGALGDCWSVFAFPQTLRILELLTAAFTLFFIYQAIIQRWSWASFYLNFVTVNGYSLYWFLKSNFDIMHISFKAGNSTLLLGGSSFLSWQLLFIWIAVFCGLSPEHSPQFTHSDFSRSLVHYLFTMLLKKDLKVCIPKTKQMWLQETFLGYHWACVLKILTQADGYTFVWWVLEVWWC